MGIVRRISTALAVSALALVAMGTVASAGVPPASHTAPPSVACVDNAYRVVWDRVGVYSERRQDSHMIKAKSKGERVTGPSGWHRVWDYWDEHYWTKVWVNGVGTGWMRSGALTYEGCA